LKSNELLCLLLLQCVQLTSIQYPMLMCWNAVFRLTDSLLKRNTQKHCVSLLVLGRTTVWQSYRGDVIPRIKKFRAKISATWAKIFVRKTSLQTVSCERVNKLEVFQIKCRWFFRASGGW